MAESDKSEFIVYEDDACLGKDLPDTSTLKFFNDDAMPSDANKVLIITFFSKLNKSDFPTLSVINEYLTKDEFKDKIEILAISRDGEESDVVKFPGKYKNLHMAEITGPGGEAGCTIKFDYPLAYDEGHKFNTALKKLAQKAVIGVGTTFIVRGGKIQWFEYFNRGNSPMGQFSEQLKNIVEGKDLISNGKMPEVEDAELEGVVPVDADPFAGVGDGY